MPDQHPLAANPLLDHQRIHELLRRHWDVGGELSDLGSLEDQNLRVRGSGDSYVVKITAAASDPAEVDLQNAAMRHLAEHPAGIDSPRVVPAADGLPVVAVDDARCRLLTWVPGQPYADRDRLRRDDLREMGALAARIAASLAGFEHPRLDRGFVWDARHSVRVVDDLSARLGDAELRREVRDGVEPLRALDPHLPTAVIHGDVTPTNVVHTSAGSGAGSAAGSVVRPSGILDFGDVMRSWRLADVAATVVGVLEHPSAPAPLAAALAVLEGYHDVTPLSAAEAVAFWPLVLARAAVNAAATHVQAEAASANWYARDGARSGRQALRAAASVPGALAEIGARDVLGLIGPYAVSRPPAELVPGLHTSAVVLDRSADTDDVRDDDWRSDRPTMAPLPDAGVVVGRWGEHRLDRGGELEADEPANLQLAVPVHVPAGTPVLLPVDGELLVVDHAAHSILVRLEGRLALRLSGLRPGSIELGPTPRGTALGHTDADSPLLVQLVRAVDLPAWGTARDRATWLVASPDPSPLLGLDVAAPAPPDVEQLRRRREDVVAAPQHLYYDDPVEIVRGRRQYLYSAAGRGYLDMVNNIAAVGHAHPGVTRAAGRQLRRLNTNSRFLYGSMTRYCEEMAARLPPELDRIFLVNSGSEAADLALQLARHATGRRDVAAIQGAYHGWTGAVLALSSSPVDRPGWRHEIEPGHHVVAAPNPYRGVLGSDVDPYVASVRQACADAADRGGLAAFISEPLLGNQGGVVPFPGYLARAYAEVRAAGGLCLADEVQVGLGRTGDFWAFEHEQVLPDIVFTAKAAGNGHPLGVVACRREVADAFDRDAAFFASTAGGPVSCEVGLAVLDAIRDDGLVANAATVGAHLKGRLHDLADHHPLIGAVHGRGLYLGVELVADPHTLEPAAAAADLVSERLLRRGVVMQPTGDDGNVLKVKPPLCLTEEAADFFVDQLDAVIRSAVRPAADGRR